MNYKFTGFDHDSCQSSQSQTVDKKQFYIWLIALLANIEFYFVLVLMEIYNRNQHVFDVLFDIATGYLLILAISIFISIISVWISGSNLKVRYKLLGFPVLLLLPIPFFIWEMYTCTGGFCSFGATVIMNGLLWSAVVFFLFSWIAIFLRKSNVKLSRALIYIELISLVGIFLLLGYLDMSLMQLRTDEPIEQEQAAQLCNSVIMSSRNLDCWSAVIKMHPQKNLCSSAKTKKSKQNCLFSLGIFYRENLENGCEHKESQLSYRLKDDLLEHERLRQCWEDKSKIYPELEICRWTYSWNKPRCNDFFRTSSLFRYAR